MRVHDELMRRAKQYPNTHNDGLGQAVVVQAGNVVSYLFEVDKIAPRYVFDLPSVVPPFEHMFIEFEVEGLGQGWYIRRVHPDYPYTGIRLYAKDTPGAQWYVGAYLYTPLHPHAPILSAGFGLNETGAVIARVPGGDPYSMKPLSPIAQQEWEKDMYKVACCASLNVAMWTIAFMHTKGADIEDVTPPAAQQKRHMKRYKAPMCSYKTIKVMGFGREPKDAQGGQHSAPRLHIVRGHWADYRFGAGMFGRPELTGIYWVREHQRGRAERGATKVDYEVNPHE